MANVKRLADENYSRGIRAEGTVARAFERETGMAATLSPGSRGSCDVSTEQHCVQVKSSIHGRPKAPTEEARLRHLETANAQGKVAVECFVDQSARRPTMSCRVLAPRAPKTSWVESLLVGVLAAVAVKTVWDAATTPPR